MTHDVSTQRLRSLDFKSPLTRGPLVAECTYRHLFSALHPQTGVPNSRTRRRNLRVSSHVGNTHLPHLLRRRTRRVALFLQARSFRASSFLRFDTADDSRDGEGGLPKGAVCHLIRFQPSRSPASCTPI